MSTDLDAIQARSQDHRPCTAEVCGSRVCQTARDRDALLALVRSQQAAIERAKAACDRVIDNTDGHKPPGPPHPSREQATAARIRAALTATEGA